MTFSWCKQLLLIVWRQAIWEERLPELNKVPCSGVVTMLFTMSKQGTYVR